MIRILYAEDDAQVADMVRLYFSRPGAPYALEVVENGHGCLERMRHGGYDVLLLDLMMPDLDGLQVLGELTSRRDPTPVIMVSGQGQHELAVRALRAGAVDCIDKNSPDFRRIAEIVERVHARRRERPPAPLPPPAEAHRVLLLEPEPTERDTAALFFASSTPRLRLSAEPEEFLDRVLAGTERFDAIVFGPTLDTTRMLNALRHLRASDETIPIIVVSSFNHAETTIAAFKLGAHDFLLHQSGWLTELVFSLNHALKQADADRLNSRLTKELAALNASLATQVAARTQELEKEIVVRREAEQRAADHAARLQALSSKLLRVQEDERRALAQELHDQIGQLLTGLRFQLEAAITAAKKNDASAEASSGPLPQALHLTTELLHSVRALTLQLRPRILDDLGLKPALEWQAETFRKQTGITIELELTLPEKRLGPELETAVFRMVQEALTNVARHSAAASAEVTVTADDSALQVEISDRGRGFDAAAALARRDSIGLAGLAERVRLAGGEFDIFSQPGQGTRLHAEFSLHRNGASLSSP